jgi:hypothetical protein
MSKLERKPFIVYKWILNFIIYKGKMKVEIKKIKIKN